MRGEPLHCVRHTDASGDWISPQKTARGQASSERFNRLSPSPLSEPQERACLGWERVPHPQSKGHSGKVLLGQLSRLDCMQGPSSLPPRPPNHSCRAGEGSL